MEQEDLRGELDRLREALLTRDSAVTALGEQATLAATQTAQLAEQVSAIGQERDRLARLLEESSEKLAEAVRERDELALARDSLARDREALAAERDVLTKERASLATDLKSVTTELKSVTTEMESLRSVVSTAAAGAATGSGADGQAGSTCALRPSDIRELGKTLELIAQAVGAVQVWTKEAAETDRGSQEAVRDLAGRLDTLLAPLATLPELRGELAGVGKRLDAINATVEVVKQAETESRELGAIKRAINELGVGMEGLHGELSSLTHRAQHPAA